MRKIQLYFIAILLLAAQVASSQSMVNAWAELVEQGYEVVNIENEGVKQFLDDDTYDNPANTGKYGLSVVQKYSAGSNSKPRGKHIKWQRHFPTDEFFYTVVSVSENWNFPIEKSKFYYIQDASTTEYTICNMLPEKIYYYKVEETDIKGTTMEVTSGKFITTGRLRMLSVDGMVNIRDFGGWRSSLGGKTNYGHIFRGGRAEGITDGGKNAIVDQEKLGADLDLRGKPLAESPFGPLNQVEYFCTNNARYKPALVGRTDIFVKDFHFIADVLGRGKSLYLHCNHGANRAGTLSFLIDGIIGLSEADISREYELSSFAYKGMRRGPNIGEMIAYIRTHGNPGDNLTQCFYNYLIKIGVSAEDIKTIRNVMVSD